MKFSTKAADLAGVLSYVTGIVPTRTTMPVLSNVIIEAEAGGIKVTGSDTAIEATATLACDVEQPGITTVPGHVLHSMARAMAKTAEVQFEAGDLRAHLLCGRASYDFQTLPVDDFPTMPAFPGNCCRFDIDAAELKGCLAAAAVAAATDGKAHVFNGVHMTMDGGRLVFVAADGVRFARVFAQTTVPNCPPVVVPNSAMKPLAVVLASGGMARVRMTDTMIEVVTPSASIVSRLMGAKYPDYKASLVKVDGVAVMVKAGALAEAIKRILLVYTGLDVRPGARITAHDGVLDISGGTHGRTQGLETIDATVFEAFEVVANSNYLLELLNEWPADATLEIGHEGIKRALKISSPAMPDQMHILMTVKPGIATQDLAA